MPTSFVSSLPVPPPTRPLTTASMSPSLGPPSRRRYTANGPWRLSKVSLMALEGYKASKFKNWEEMLSKPSCEAAFARMLQIGPVNRLYVLYPAPEGPLRLRAHPNHCHFSILFESPQYRTRLCILSASRFVPDRRITFHCQIAPPPRTHQSAIIPPRGSPDSSLPPLPTCVYPLPPSLTRFAASISMHFPFRTRRQTPGWLLRTARARK